jgi:hypothetical protein
MTEDQAIKAAQDRFPGYDAQASRIGDRCRLVLTPTLVSRLPGISEAEFESHDEPLVAEGDSFEEALLNLAL